MKSTSGLKLGQISSCLMDTLSPTTSPWVKAVKKTRVLIIDEHPSVLRALAARLATTPHIQVIATAKDLPEGRKLAELKHPDAVLLGLRALRKARETTGIKALASELDRYQAGLIVLTTLAVEDERKAMLAAGAKRYLLKDIDSRRLIAEINAVVPEV
jgi:DNA-binding NarL/FixJ family response regulator